MLWAAFITGLIGSLHCAGMCGPLLCAVPMDKRSPSREWTSLFVYNTGRIVSYALLGLLMGLGGAVLLKAAGAWFAYVAGALLLGLGVYKLFRGRTREWSMPAFMRRWMGMLFRTRSPWVLPLLGMLNGLIPCGVVYAALAGASVTADPWQGALYMLVFGLATWPALFSGYYLVGRLAGRLRKYYRPAGAVFLCILGVWLWVRAFRGQESFGNAQTITVCE